MSKETIVITDGRTLNPGDLSWKGLEELGALSYFDRCLPSEVADRCKDATIIVTNKTPISKETIDKAANLKVIAVTATGYNIVDVEAARARSIPVCNVPEYGTYSVAQHAMALLLELTNHVGVNAQSVAKGDWSVSPDFSYSRKPIIELQDKTLGIIGLGRIGQQLAVIAGAFGMKVIYSSRKPKVGWPHFYSEEEVFEQSDFISVHCPLTKENAGFINTNLLTRMKPSAYLINTSRGALINEQDLAEVLKANRIGGAALDVLSIEPPPANHPLIGLPNCIITPHNAWLSREARERILQVTVQNVVLALKSTPQNVVN
jgi:glycerate dehydrogenase